MKKTALILVLVLTLLGGSVQAQEAPSTPQTPPGLQSLGVALWPEYDRPDMLVIEQGEFAAATALPVEVELRIPAVAGKPSAVAFVDDSGSLLTQPYTTRVEGDWLVVSFTLASLGFQVEYYAPLTVQGDGRSFAYTYLADYDTAAFSLETQVPPTAGNYALNPAADSVEPQSDGLTYHVVQPRPAPRGESRSWTVTYTKPDQTLTADTLAASAPAVETPAAPGPAQNNNTVWIFMVAFIALVAVAGGAFWLGHRVQTPPAPVSRRPPTGKGLSLGETLFCRSCGARLREDADYCHKCGAGVRGRPG